MRGLPRGRGWACAMLVLAMVGLGAGGCQRFKRQQENVPRPPDYVKVTGSGRPGPVRTTSGTLVFTGILRGPVTAEAAAPLDKRVADPATRLMMAQAAARKKALRALGRVILETRDMQGAALGEALKSSPLEQSKLEKLLEEQARLDYRDLGEEVRATATIDGQRVLDTLGLIGPQLAGPAQAPPAPETKELAYNLALEDAKKKLEQALLAEKLPDGRILKQALADNPSATTDFNALIWVVQPDETQYLNDGSCQVTIFFDRNRLADIFKVKRRWWTHLMPWKK